MPKISYQEYQQLLMDLDTSDATIASYSILVPGSGAFDLRLMPDPDRVEMTSGSRPPRELDDDRQ